MIAMSKTERSNFGDKDSFSSADGSDEIQQLSVLICPGFHDASLTDSFVRSLPAFVAPHIVRTFPADPFATLKEMTRLFQNQLLSQPVVGIGFSGGVVGLVGASKIWQQQGGAIAQLLAIDGWGVPALGLPICRISHDAFTHWSSATTEPGSVNFYADPPVEHLKIWQAPEQVNGFRLSVDRKSVDRKSVDRKSVFERDRMTVAEFLSHQLAKVLEAQQKEATRTGCTR